jgi:hypothetical protein
MMNGWSYRVDYPYYSWAETVVRPHITRRDFKPLVANLNELEGRSNGSVHGETAQGRWALDDQEMTSAIKFMDEGGILSASTLSPEIVAKEMRAALGETKAGAAQGG